MTDVPIHKAKANLSSLIARALAGEEVVIARGKTPVVRLVPYDRPAPGRCFGALRGKVTFDDAFFDALPESELAAWE